MHVFKKQSLLTIKLETNYSDLAAASTTKILYKKPDETKGEWSASVAGTKLVYNLTNGEIDQIGTWEFQAYIVVGGLEGFGNIATHLFSKSLK